MTKRLFDLALACAGLLVFSPVFLLVALAIGIGDGWPLFYRQERVGRGGRPFRIWKFRTMTVNADRKGPSVTVAGDSRVTRIGRFLRKWKLDELPQLFNVLAGEMSFVGPRPEVPAYVALYAREQRRVLELKPGITDLATLEFRNEEELLANAIDPQAFYREYCIPRKIELNLQYASHASLGADVRLILATLLAIGGGGSKPEGRRGRAVSKGVGLLLIASGLLLAAVVATVISGRQRPEAFKGGLRRLMPQQNELGEWTVTPRPVADTVALQDRTRDVLNYNDAVNADYVRGDLRVSIFAAYWEPGRMSHRLVAGHTPDLCWVGGGWERISGHTIKLAIPGRENIGLSVENREYRLDGRTEFVFFCHIVDGQVLRYGDGIVPPWYSFVADLLERGLQQRQEQFFLRVSSNRPLEEFRDTAPVRLLLTRFGEVLRDGPATKYN